MNENNDNSLGSIIRVERRQRRLTMRTLAEDLRITHPYLSDIEKNRRIPSEVVLARMAVRLDLNFDLLMQLAGRVGETAEQYVQSSLLAGVVFRKIAEYEFDDEGLVRILDFVEDLNLELAAKRREAEQEEQELYSRE